MFSKVLVSDDLGSINQGVLTVLDTLKVPKFEQVQYCDDAYIKIKRGIHDKEPYQLLITDLSFKVDHREQKFSSGEDLIKELRAEHPELKIIVYSVEDRLQKVRTLMQIHKVDAYVCKGRRGLIELAEAIDYVYNNNTFVSHQIAHALSPKADLEIEDYDIDLIKHMANGLSQDEISQVFKNNNISPSSLSSIEKRLNKLRIQFKANNAIHLVAIVKDLGLI
ncbi:MAG: response regulator [Psychroserpens sp.]|uniref:response regulator n=1 Tax=Psychroserpens sp. TaxID=2020870 RepID=UPI003003A4A7